MGLNGVTDACTNAIVSDLTADGASCAKWAVHCSAEVFSFHINGQFGRRGHRCFLELDAGRNGGRHLSVWRLDQRKFVLRQCCRKMLCPRMLKCAHQCLCVGCRSPAWSTWIACGVQLLRCVVDFVYSTVLCMEPKSNSGHVCWNSRKQLAKRLLHNVNSMLSLGSSPIFVGKSLCLFQYQNQKKLMNRHVSVEAMVQVLTRRLVRRRSCLQED